jgi:hypothetical protein
VGAKTVTEVLEFCTAARRGPPTAEMAATSCLRPAPWATDRRVAPPTVVLAGGSAITAGNDERSRAEAASASSWDNENSAMFRFVGDWFTNDVCDAD